MVDPGTFLNGRCLRAKSKTHLLVRAVKNRVELTEEGLSKKNVASTPIGRLGIHDGKVASIAALILSQTLTTDSEVLSWRNLEG